MAKNTKKEGTGRGYRGEPIERFWKKVDKSSEGCWLWVGATDSNGYGVFQFRGRLWRAHRAGYTLLVQEIPDGMLIDHTCRNKICVKPDHLQIADKSTNGQNLSGAHKDSATGVRNVVRHANRYRVRCHVKGKSYEGGIFDDLEEAAEAAEKLRLKVQTNNLKDRGNG